MLACLAEGTPPARSPCHDPEVTQEYAQFEDPEACKFTSARRCPVRRKTLAVFGVLLLSAALTFLMAGSSAQKFVERLGRPRLRGWGGAAAPLGDCDVNVIIARHCDKNPPWSSDPTPQELCTVDGLLRGENMARVFAEHGAFPVPTRLYARQMPQDVYSSRDLYLLWPLAQRYGLLVNTSFTAARVLDLASTLLQERSSLCGQTVLVSWDHCAIPTLAQALGCTHEACMTCWDDDDYDSMLWLRFGRSRDGAWNLRFKPGHEGYRTARGLGGYRECIGNPVENGVFGFSCAPPAAWSAPSLRPTIPPPSA